MVWTLERYLLVISYVFLGFDQDTVCYEVMSDLNVSSLSRRQQVTAVDAGVPIPTAPISTMLLNVRNAFIKCYILDKYKSSII